MDTDLAYINKKYGQKDFKYILDSILNWCGGLDNLKDKSILELGPGTKLNMLNFLKNETDAANVTAAGKTLFSTDVSVTDCYILPYLKKQKSKSIDLIYSKHLFESSSIHPVLLLSHPAYWRAIKENRFDNPGVDFPSSIANMQAIFIEAYRVLKSGGLIVSQIGRRKKSALTPAFLKSLKPAAKKIHTQDINRMSYIIQVVK